MNARLWYPQLDVYDCIRRSCALLRRVPAGLNAERLYILDFFMANPPLLHRTKMLQAVRARFRNLEIPAPEHTFLAYPAAPLLFHKMASVQKAAVRALAGKDLIAADPESADRLALSARGLAFVETAIAPNVSTDEAALAQFLTETFGAGEGLGDLRASTGLRRST